MTSSILTIEKLESLLKKYDLKYAFSHFSTQIAPPFLIYLNQSSDNFVADNKVYQAIDHIRLELYTRCDTTVQEKNLESFLDKNSVLWNKISQEWIDDEKIMMTIYELS